MGHRHTSTRTAMKLILATSLSVALASSTPLSRELTPPWVEACNGSYLFSEDKKTWNDAYGECELYGSHLVQIDGLAENFCLLKYAHAEGLPADRYWHSANDNMAEAYLRSLGAVQRSAHCGLHFGNLSTLMAVLAR